MSSLLMKAFTHGARGLARAPQFTAAAVLTLGLAVGTNAAIFSVVQGVLLKPLPFAEPERLVMLRHSAPGLGYPEFGMSTGLFVLYGAADQAFESTGIFATTTLNATGGDAPPGRLEIARVSRDVFTTLGVAPARGRVFDEAEDREDGPPVVVLSHGLWQERFGGAAEVVGRVLEIDGTPHTVVGVMPASFTFPSSTTRAWLPFGLDPADEQYGNFTAESVARLRRGVDPEAARAQLLPVLERLRDAPESSEDLRAFMNAGQLTVVVRSLKERVVGDVSRALWILLGTVAFVFLIACANVANLFLVRAEARQAEMAVRAAMGARRAGLIGHYAVEAAIIALAGGVLGLLLAWSAVRFLVALAPPGIPRLYEVGIDPVVLAFTLVVSLFAALLLGVLPALRLTSPALLTVVSRGSRGATAGRQRHRVRHALVVAQTALALVLLVGSGLMVRSFQNLRALEPGFDPHGATTFRLSLSTTSYGDAAAVARFHGELRERLRALPGVEQVGATSHPPLRGCCSGTAHILEDFPVAPGEMPPMFWYSTVLPGYFEAMRIPLVAGRFFDTSDADEGRYSVVVSADLARRYWPDTDPVGRRLRPSATSDNAPWYTVVGVAGSVRDRELQSDPSMMVYYPVTAQPPPIAAQQARSMTYVLRSARPDDVAALARSEVWAMDANLPVDASATLERIVAESMIRVRFTMLALVAAALIALVLGAVGLYSVISYIVVQRTGEIGIRLALGAGPAQVRRMVVLQGARVVAVGLLVGFAGAVALTRLMQGVLYGTEPTDPATFTVVSALLAVIALLATWVPARRASRIDPAESLKSG